MAYSWTFNYTGGMQSLSVPAGRYFIECYGAGGGNDSCAGGKGGYSSGIVTLPACTLRIGVGGAGQNGRGVAGGWGGGGRSGYAGTSGSGGGASWVANDAVGRGVLANYNSYRHELICVAGGGGGGGAQSVGGAGGGSPAGGRHNGDAVTSDYGWLFGIGEDRGEDRNRISGTCTWTSKNTKDSVVAVSFTSNATGWVEFWASSYTANPHGDIWVNGKRKTDGHINGQYIDVWVNEGDYVALCVSGCKAKTGTCEWQANIPGSVAGDGGGGGGGYYGGYRAIIDAGGGGGSGYVSSSCVNGKNITGGGSATASHGKVVIHRLVPIYNPLAINRSHTFPYVGYAEGIILEPGLYRFECWGGSGGGGEVNAHTSGSAGGMGGYTSCIMRITQRVTVYAFAGGAGVYGTGTSQGGWNGGGNSGSSTSCASGSGGGASDFRVAINDERITYLNPLNYNSLLSRFSVAGGGGGADNAGSAVGGGDDGSGGSGGGLNSEGYWIDGTYYASGRATQTSGAGFGYGANSTSGGDTGGGGGGWYGGYCSNHGNGGAGGGSSYIKGYPGCNTAYVSYQSSAIAYQRDGKLQLYGRTGHGMCKVTRLIHQVNIIYVNATGTKATLNDGESTTAIANIAVNQYPIKWGITSGWAFASTSITLEEGRAVFTFKAPDVVTLLGTQITITATIGTYASLIAVNCQASNWFIKPNTPIRITADSEKDFDNYIKLLKNFGLDRVFFKKVTVVSQTEIYIETDILTNGGTYYVEGLYVRKRTNTDIYEPLLERIADISFLNK